ncbi:MAG: hypothetical protein SFY80_06215 [Verrucomicrobiota bacterium]|nr:hypothetical protein [Verrucomicrobiota bacterium]
MKKPVTEDALQELRSYIQRDVDAGFLPEGEIAKNAVEILADDYDANVLTRQAVRMTLEIIDAHKQEQASWPQTTDCDRLDTAFAALERAGVVARQDFCCCGNCGAGEIREEMDKVAQSGTRVRGYAFYHMQDTEAAVDGGGLYLNFGAVQEGKAAAIEIGREIVATLKQQGLQVNWDETWAKRIGVQLDWKRRR